MHRVEKSQTNEKSLVERFNVSQRLPGAFILSSYIQMRLLCQIRPLTSKSLKQVQRVWKCTVESTHRLMRLLCQMKPLKSKSLKQVHSEENSNYTHERIVEKSQATHRLMRLLCQMKRAGCKELRLTDGSLHALWTDLEKAKQITGTHVWSRKYFCKLFLTVLCSKHQHQFFFVS